VPQLDIENARRGYEVLNEAYRRSDPSVFLPILEEFWDPDVVFVPAGVLPESEVVRGREAMIDFMKVQMQAFEAGSMFIEPLEFIEVGSTIVVPYRFGGRANHTGIDVEFSFVHVFTQRHGKTVRVDVYETQEDALEDLGAPDAS
jgi:ketosteroid isomerase-like protein